MNVTTTAVAGTMESSDVMVTMAPREGGIAIDLDSTVEKQFGRAIRAAILEELDKLGIASAEVRVVDKGALECVIRARVKACAYRACQCEAYQWG